MGGAALSTVASQAAFRVVLDTLANPGRQRRLDVNAGVPPALMLPLALADLTQRVAVVGDQAARWEARLVVATGCRIAAPADADQVVALPGSVSPALVAGVRRGSAVTPEGGARVSIGCAALGADGDVELRLRGPGVDGVTTIGVSGCPGEVFDGIAAANADFPAGIDVWLVATDGAVVGLPRSTRLEVTTWAT
jgi:alpha-D-ribose 1-methylphosphonate 5-triphosphate synthase subunit PhnH